MSFQEPPKQYHCPDWVHWAAEARLAQAMAGLGSISFSFSLMVSKEASLACGLGSYLEYPPIHLRKGSARALSITATTSSLPPL